MNLHFFPFQTHWNDQIRHESSPSKEKYVNLPHKHTGKYAIKVTISISLNFANRAIIPAISDSRQIARRWFGRENFRGGKDRIFLNKEL